jgi:hypothetical protein
MGMDWLRRLHTTGTGDAFPPFPPQHQRFFLVEPVHALVVHDVPITPQQHGQPPIAKARAVLRQLTQALSQLRIVDPA